MSSVTPSATSTIDLNDPRLHTLQPQHKPYFPIEYSSEGAASIRSEFQGLHQRTLNTILALVAYGNKDGAASRCANCGKHGSLYRADTAAAYADGYRQTCHLWICVYCGVPMNRLYSWSKDRSAAVATTPQTGIEISGPGTPDDLHALATQLAVAIGATDNARHTIPRLKSCSVSGVRMLVPLADLNYASTVRTFREFAGPEYVMTLYRKQSIRNTLLWWLQSTDEARKLAPGKLVEVYAEQGHMIRTSGRFYNPIKDGPTAFDVLFPSDLGEPSSEASDAAPVSLDILLASDLFQVPNPEDLTPSDIRAMQAYYRHPELCPCGEGKSHYLQYIPFSQRKVERIEDIERQYKTVRWGEEDRLRRRAQPMAKSGDRTNVGSRTPSPPS